MKTKFALIFFLAIFLSLLNAEEAQLRFYTLTDTDPIIIPQEIDFNEFEASCTIKYTYDGDWIGGCSFQKFCTIFRDYFYHAHLTYLDDNNKQLFGITLPDSLQVLKGIRINSDLSGMDDNFVFREDKVYSTDIQLLSRQFFQLEKLKELICAKRIHKIKLELEKVVVKWYYYCESQEERKEKTDVKKKGVFVLKVDKTCFIKVQYNNNIIGDK
jgi:hypothetical protein